MGGVTVKFGAAAFEVALVEGAAAPPLGAGGVVVAGEGLAVGVRKPFPTPTAVVTVAAPRDTRGAGEPLLEFIAGGDSQYAANSGNTVHLSPPAKTDRWLGSLQRGVI